MEKCSLVLFVLLWYWQQGCQHRTLKKERVVRCLQLNRGGGGERGGSRTLPPAAKTFFQSINFSWPSVKISSCSLKVSNGTTEAFPSLIVGHLKSCLRLSIRNSFQKPMNLTVGFHGRESYYKGDREKQGQDKFDLDLQISVC